MVNDQQTTPTTHIDPLEDRMSIREVFTKAADSIVEASHLQTEVIPGLNKQLEELRSTIEGLKHDIEWVRARNSQLDETLNHTRRQRDEAQAETAKVRQEFAEATAAHEKAHAELQDNYEASKRNAEYWQAQYNETSTKLTEARRDRDDAELKIMELQERVDSFRKQQEAVASALSGLTSALGLPNPTPKGEEVHRPLTEAGPSGGSPGYGGQPRTEDGKFQAVG